MFIIPCCTGRRDGCVQLNGACIYYYTQANWCSLPTQLSEEGGSRNSSRQARRREGGDDGGHFLTLSAFTLKPEEGFAFPESHPGKVLPLPWG